MGRGRRDEALPARTRRSRRPRRRRRRPARDRRAPAEHQDELPAGGVAVAAAVRRPADARAEHHRTPGKLADFIASSLSTISTAAKQEVLETLDVRARMDQLEPDPHQGARGPRAGHRRSSTQVQVGDRTRTSASTSCASS
ncbi:MAG: hypothetical protein M0C28_13335 [Candidatus Moduliflexus flocculans]|nr:hypothetical protein [Candidatus Moduliflexus flocculans]